MAHTKKWPVKSDFPRGLSVEIFLSKKLFENEKNLLLKINNLQHGSFLINYLMLKLISLNHLEFIKN